MGSQLITTTQTWDWPAGVTTVVAEGVGGGGAGGYGAANPSNGGGGKGGSYAKKTITKGAETSLTVNVGAGAVSGTTVTPATASTVVQSGTTVMSAAGGATPATDATAGATALVGSNIGDTVFAGGNGGNSTGTTTPTSSGGGGGAAGPSSVGGAASGGTAGSVGSGLFLDGTVPTGNGASGVAVRTVGTVGTVYGGAGSGGNTNQATDKAGGNGAAGVVILTWTDPVFAATQNAFRFYDEGTEAGSTALAALNTNYTASMVLSGSTYTTWQDTLNMNASTPNLSLNAGFVARASSVEFITPTSGEDVYFEYSGAAGEANFGGATTTVFLVPASGNGVDYPRTVSPNTYLTGQVLAVRGQYGATYDAAGTYISPSPLDIGISAGDRIRLGFDGNGHSKLRYFHNGTWSTLYTSSATYTGSHRLYVEFAADGGTNQITNIIYG